jgi:hypothetical protein
MRSLATRLALAFALVSLAGIGLAALFVRQLVVSEFDTFVREQRRSAFIEQVCTYYDTHGSWDGISRTVLGAPAEQQPGPPRSGGPPDAQSEAGIAFVLADSNGTVVLSPNPDERGRPARSRELANGVPIEVDGQFIGTVLPFDSGPRRNPAEQRYLARTDVALAAAALVAVTVSLALGLLLARLITRPVRDLTAAARAIAGGELRRWRASEGWAERRGETSASKGRGARQRSGGMGRLNAQGDELAKRAGLRRLREAMLACRAAYCGFGALRLPAQAWPPWQWP